jgi:hypothetical protein
MHGSCSDNIITASNSIAYNTITRECQENEIGYIAWSWFGNCNSLWDMTTSGTFASLYDWGLEVATTDVNSITNTSVRPYSVVNSVCDPNSVEPTGETTTHRFMLYPNKPNPFTLSTLISYKLAEEADIRLIVYNYQGTVLSKLIDMRQSPGNYSIRFDTGNLSAGIYFYTLIVDGAQLTRRMLLSK